MIVAYSTNCPKCRILKKKLEKHLRKKWKKKMQHTQRIHQKL